jgi:phosphoadenosine phosphosulfate reductase
MIDPDQIDIEALKAMDAPELLRYAFETHGERAAIGTSLQKSGVVQIDLASKLDAPFRVFFVDTELDYPETYELIDRVNERYGIEVERFRPRKEETEPLRRRLGRFEHYMNRQECCHVRKVLPLRRAMATLDVWISGLRTDQSMHRKETAERVAWVTDAAGRDILKLNPLLDWTADDVEAYIRENDVPYNALYDYVSEYGERFHVISCQRCHIPVKDIFGPRAGKWPWEAAGKRECGIHEHGSGI